MYKILGADGKEYGPASLDQLKDWIAQGRINAQTKVQAAGSSEWKPASEVSELGSLFISNVPRPPGEGAPPILKPVVPPTREKGLAVLSFVLGLAAFVLCLGALAGIPAVICGHVARRRAIRFPEKHAGVSFAMAGLVLGYAGVVFSFVIAAMVLPAIGKAKHRVETAEVTSCENNLKQIGLAFKVWALDHGDQYPFNVSTNSGGTLEFCATGPDGFDTNAVAHFRIISQELSTPQFLVCPQDSARHPASDFESLRLDNVTYQLRTGTNINAENPQNVLVVCPIHGNKLFCDGNVRKSH